MSCSAIHRVRFRTGQRTFWFANQLAQVRLSGDDTGGAMAVVEVESPAGPAAPLHVHSQDDETFYIVDGEVTFYIGERVEHARAGALVHAPRRIPHTLTVDSPRARWLVLATPAGFEDFLAQVGAAAPRAELPDAPVEADPGEIAAAAREHGIEVLGPPGTLPAR